MLFTFGARFKAAAGRAVALVFEALSGAAPSVSLLGLTLTDRSGPRYTMQDQSGGRYALTDQSGPVYQLEDTT